MTTNVTFPKKAAVFDSSFHHDYLGRSLFQFRKFLPQRAASRFPSGINKKISEYAIKSYLCDDINHYRVILGHSNIYSSDTENLKSRIYKTGTR